MPMRKLVQLAILSAKARALVDGKEFNGLTLQPILKWLGDNGFGANYGTVVVTLSTLHKKQIVNGGYNDSPCYLWNTVN